MRILFTLLLFFTFFNIYGQLGSFAWGIKGGPVMAFQRWDQTDRDPLWGPHAILFIETLSDEREVGLFAQAGYHTRGSAIRVRGFNFNDPITGEDRRFGGSTTKYDFQNVVLSLGFKQRFSMSRGNLYYLLSLRGEYNISNGFDQFADLPLDLRPFFPQPAAVNDLVGGFIFGGGVEIPISDYIDATVELTVNPDFTKQYYQIPLTNIPSPYGGVTSLPERNIRNNTIELSVGFRFLRVVEYVD